MLQSLVIPENPHRTARSCFNGYQYGLVRQESVRVASEGLKTLLQPMGDHLGQPEMQRTRDQSWCIRRLGQVIAQLMVNEIRHPLGRSCLLHITLLPTGPFQFFLEPHHLQGVVAFYILSPHLDHHTRIAPLGTTTGRTHAVDHNLFLVGGSGNHEPSRTHTERIHATPLYLCHHGIFGSRQILASALLRMILYLVDQMRWMFQSDAYGNSLCLDFNLCFRQISVNVSCRVTCGQNHRTTEF